MKSVGEVVNDFRYSRLNERECETLRIAINSLLDELDSRIEYITVQGDISLIGYNVCVKETKQKITALKGGL